MVDLNFSLVGGNGDTIRFYGSSDFYLTRGLRGLGIPATEVRITNSAGDGGTWRSTRRGVRTLDLPIFVVGTDREDVETKLRRLASALSDRYGTPFLLAEYSDGSSYQMEIHYTGGAETQFGDEAGETFCKWAITVQAPDPYWTSTQAVSFALANSSGGRGLLPHLEKLQVTSSSLLGTFNIENTGDVEAFPVWTLHGPLDDATFSRDGLSFAYVDGISSGESVVIDTMTATVRDANNVNKYGSLGPAPKLFAFPPGISSINVVVTGSDTETRVSGFYRPRREVLH